jgi:glycosyltransferase involved in cell wall biosynthesis
MQESTARKTVVHVAAVEISEETGMGRVAWHWRDAFRKAGYEFIHIGPGEVGNLAHPALFPYAARRFHEKAGYTPDILLVHEPAAGSFVRAGHPLVVFSHGSERRNWELNKKSPWEGRIRARTRLLFPIWRLRHCDAGMKRASLVLAINNEDRDFIRDWYVRAPETIRVFRNGVYPSGLSEREQPEDRSVVLFMGSWLKRKGIETIVKAAVRAHNRGQDIRWVLAGTGLAEAEVRRAWPGPLQPSLEIIPHFPRQQETAIIANANVCILPSFFEGQPLALLQAMEAGRCCVTTDCCGQRDIVKHGVTGLLHAPGDDERLASLIVECLQDRERRMKIGRLARSAMVGRTWSAVSAEVVQVVEHALGTAPPAASPT